MKDEQWHVVQFMYEDGPVYMIWASCSDEALHKLKKHPYWRKNQDLVERYAAVVQTVRLVGDIVRLDNTEDLR